MKTINVFLLTLFLTACSSSEFTGEKGEIDMTMLVKCGLPYKEPVILFTAEWCSACKSAKSQFDRRNIKYYEIDAEASPENTKMYECAGGYAYPYLIVEGKRVDVTDKKEVNLALKPYMQ